MVKVKVKKWYSIDIEEDVYNILCVYLYLFRYRLKNGLSATYSDVLKEVFKEANFISPADSVLHYGSADFDYILDFLHNL